MAGPAKKRSNRSNAADGGTQPVPTLTLRVYERWQYHDRTEEHYANTSHSSSPTRSTQAGSPNLESRLNPKLGSQNPDGKPPMEEISEGSSPPPYTPAPDASTKIVNTWKPSSKTAVGRLNYHLNLLPRLFIAVVKTSSDGEPIKSRRLRHQALREFIGTKFRSIKHNITINTKVTSGPKAQGNTEHFLDHLIIPIFDDDHHKQLVALFRPNEAHVLEGLKKGSDDDVKAIQCEISDEPFYVTGTLVKTPNKTPNKTLNRNTMHTKEFLDKLYWSSLNVFIRHRASRDNCRSDYDISHEFIENFHLPGQDARQLDPFLQSTVPALWDTISGFRLYLRNRPSIDSQQEDSVLRLDYDLVPYIPKKPVHGVLFNIFGSSVVGSDASSHLSRIKHILHGLHVRCAYIAAKGTPGDLRGRVLENGNLCLGTPDQIRQGRQCQIKDIKMPGDVENFVIDGKSYSVHKYFNTFIMQDGQKLQYPGLPLANIGRNRDVWVPLEMIIVDHPQALTQSGHLTEAIQSKIAQFLRNGGQEAIRDYGQDFWDSINTFRFDEKEECKLMTAYDDVVFVPAPGYQVSERPREAGVSVSEIRPSKKVLKDNLSAYGGIIYVAPANGKAPDSDTLRRVKSGLQAADCTSVNITIRSERELVALEGPDNSLIPLFERNKKVDFIIGIIDERGRTNAEIRNIKAELHKLGERRVGAIVICTKRQHLSKLFADHPDESNYFPLNLIAKINYMLGSATYQTTHILPTEPIALNHMMIVGAHIAHPNADSAEHCPSVASVVASIDDTALHYPASARVQRTIRGAKLDEDPSKRYTESEILNLKDMMKERFESWANRDVPPTSIVFFRDSIAADDKQRRHISLKESHAITDAYVSVFRSEHAPSISYVIVAKNTDCVLDEKNEYLLEDDKVARYRYVVCAKKGVNASQLRDLTIKLNESSQLLPKEDRVSKALPVMFAKRLSDRMYDYFRFYVTRDFSRVPSIIRATPSNNECIRENEMVAFVDDYLLGNKSGLESQSDQADHAPGDKSNGTGPATEERRLRPWKKALDNKMFYL